MKTEKKIHFDEGICRDWLKRQKDVIEKLPIKCPKCSKYVPLINECESCNEVLLVKYESSLSKIKTIVLFLFMAIIMVVFGYHAIGFLFTKAFPDLHLESPTIKVFVAIILTGTILKLSWVYISEAFNKINKVKEDEEISRIEQLAKFTTKSLKKGLISQSARCFAECITLTGENEFLLNDNGFLIYKKILFKNIEPVEVDVMLKNLFIYEAWLQLRRETLPYSSGIRHVFVFGMKSKIYKIIQEIISDNEELLILSNEFRYLRYESEKATKVLNKMIELAKSKAPKVAKSLATFPD